MVTYKSWNFPYLSHFKEGREHSATKDSSYNTNTHSTHKSLLSLSLFLTGQIIFFYM